MKYVSIPAFLLLFIAVSCYGEVKHFGFSISFYPRMNECLSCHNGSRAKPVTSCDSRMCRIYGKHIVDVPYPPPGKERKYATVDEVEISGLSLEDGKLSCISCHSMLAENRALLAFDTAEEKLCRVCHRL